MKMISTSNKQDKILITNQTKLQLKNKSRREQIVEIRKEDKKLKRNFFFRSNKFNQTCLSSQKQLIVLCKKIKPKIEKEKKRREHRELSR